MCHTHYSYALKHRQFQPHWFDEPAKDQQQQLNGYSRRTTVTTFETPASNGCFDRRFCGIFLSELEQRGNPAYPEPHWFGALRQADRAYTGLGPLKPAMKASQSSETAGVPEGRQLYGHAFGSREEITLKQVNGACTRWLSEHDQSAQPRSWMM